MKKYLYLGFVGLLLIMTYAGVNLFRDSYSAGNYYYGRRIKTGVYLTDDSSRKRTSTGMGYFTLRKGSSSNPETISAFCAAYGKTALEKTGKTYSRYEFDEYYSNKDANWRKIVKNILYLYSPDIAYNGNSTDTPALQALKTNLQTYAGASVYAANDWENLNEKEALVSFQSAIWDKTDGLDWGYGNHNTNNRINTLIKFLLQTSGPLDIPETNNATIVFKTEASLDMNSGVLEAKISQKNSPSDFDAGLENYNLTFKSNTGIDIPGTTTVGTLGSKEVVTMTFPDVTMNADGSMTYSGNTFNEIVITINYTQTDGNKRAYVYKPDDSGNYQIYAGAEQTVADGMQTLRLTPNVNRVDLTIWKVDKNDNGHNLEGAYLSLYRVDGSENVLIDEFVTTSSSYTVTGLIPGKYKIIESITPNGYQIVPNILTVNGNKITASSGKEFELTTGGATYEVEIVNEQTEITIKKTDKSGNVLSGAKFSIIDPNGQEYYQFTSGNTNVSIVGQLETGTYFIEEIEAPTNYKLNKNLYRFVIGDGAKENLASDIDEVVPDKQYSTRQIVDLAITSGVGKIENEKRIVISKRDIANSSVYVIGAQLTIYEKGTTNIAKDKLGNDLQWTTTNEEHEVEIPDGEYTLTETITAGGYSTAESIDFKISGGAVVNDTDLNMKDARLNVCFVKYATGGTTELAGAEFELYNEADELVANFVTADEQYCFNDDTSKAITNDMIKPGKYTLKEVKAPKGYKISNKETEITIEDTADLQLFTVYDDIEVPNTALNTSKTIYILAIIFGAFGMGLMIYYAKKHSYEI